MSDRSTILFVDESSSRCGNCGRETLPTAIRHDDIAGWQNQPGAGCGVQFASTAAGHSAVTRDDLRRLRPDLPVYGDPP